MSTVAKIHQGLGFLFLTLGIVMFYLAGLGAILGALHPVNALLVLGAAHQAARGLPLPVGGGPSRAPSRT